MRVINNPSEAKACLDNIRKSLSKDNFCWKNWSAAHVMPDDEVACLMNEKIQAKIFGFVQVLAGPIDGIIICLEDGGILILHNYDEQGTLRDVASAINHSSEIKVPYLHSTHFQLSEEIEDIILFVEMHIKESDAADIEPAQQGSVFTFPLNNFLDTWLAICESREERKTPNILVVDDDPIARKIIRNAFSHEYPLATAQNAKEAVEKHLVLAPDIIFLDIGLPDEDGFTVLEHIRSYDPSCKIVMFSGNSFLDNRLRALSSGAEGFLPKPFNQESFVHYIDDWKQDRMSQFAAC